MSAVPRMQDAAPVVAEIAEKLDLDGSDMLVEFNGILLPVQPCECGGRTVTIAIDVVQDMLTISSVCECGKDAIVVDV